MWFSGLGKRKKSFENGKRIFNLPDGKIQLPELGTDITNSNRYVPGGDRVKREFFQQIPPPSPPSLLPPILFGLSSPLPLGFKLLPFSSLIYSFIFFFILLSSSIRFRLGYDNAFGRSLQTTGVIKNEGTRLLDSKLNLGF